MKSLLILITYLYSISGFKIYNNILTLHNDIEESKGIAADDGTAPVIFINFPSTSDNPLVEITDAIKATEPALELTSVAEPSESQSIMPKATTEDKSPISVKTSVSDLPLDSTSDATLNFSAMTSPSVSQIEESSTITSESANDSAGASISTESSVSQSVNDSIAIHGSTVPSTIVPESPDNSTGSSGSTFPSSIASEPVIVVSSGSSETEAPLTNSTTSINVSLSDSATENTSPLRSAVTSLSEDAITNSAPINLANAVKVKEILPDSAPTSTSATDSVTTTTSSTDLTTDLILELQTATEDLSFLSLELLPPKTAYRKNEPDPRYDY